REAEQASDSELLNIANIFIEHGQDEVAEQLVQERAQKTKGTHLLDWLKKRYLARGDNAAALEIAEMMFRTFPSLEGYKEIRQISEQLGRWETLRTALLDFLNQGQRTALLIHIALYEGDIDKALELVKAQEKSEQ